METKYQTFWPRFWAIWIDLLVLLPISWLGNFIWNRASSIPVLLLCIWYTFDTLLEIAYSIYFHGKCGQTPGKMVFSIKVMDVSETRPIDYIQAIKRESIPLFAILVWLPFMLVAIFNGTYLSNTVVANNISFVMLIWYFLEFATMLFNAKRRAIHDLIARSVVVKTT